MSVYQLARILTLITLMFVFTNSDALAQLGTFGSLGEEQAAEKSELEQMRQELSDVKNTTHEAVRALHELHSQVAKQDVKEIHLIAKEAVCEICPGIMVNCLTYNGHLPGPMIVLREGQVVRIVLHNQLKVPTSLYFHGMLLGHAVDGLPRFDAGLIKPGETYAYQFVVSGKGTYWYHPQVIHSDQKAKGLCGAIVVEPSQSPAARVYDREVVILFSDLLTTKAPGVRTSAINSNGVAVAKVEPTSPVAKTFNAITPTNETGKQNELVTFFLMNGLTAPAIPPIEVASGARVKLSLVNAGQKPVPLHLGGHRFEIIAINGDPVQVSTVRDTITLGVSDRVDIEFTANNPGVWSLASEEVEQTTNNGRFPGGMACVVRYSETANNLTK